MNQENLQLAAALGAGWPVALKPSVRSPIAAIRLGDRLHAPGVAREESTQIKVGDPMDASVVIGPLANKPQFDKVQRMIETGVREGAMLVCGGTGRPTGVNRGYFVCPTVFADVTPDMTIAREEIFGPVLSM